jgi:hypothetical protein
LKKVADGVTSYSEGLEDIPMNLLREEGIIYTSSVFEYAKGHASPTCYSNNNLPFSYPSCHAEENFVSGMKVIKRSSKGDHGISDRGAYRLLSKGRCSKGMFWNSCKTDSR